MLTSPALRRTRWLALGLWLLAGLTGVAAPVISEFLAVNESNLADEDGEFSDWIEIHNPDATPVALAGYSLSDSPTRLRRWVFPAVTLAAGEDLIVFASGKNRTDPAARLHTDFRLAAEGGFLALTAPDGTTVVSAFSPGYPIQIPNRSFGVATNTPSPGWSYFSTPTPGAPNGAGERAGPVIYPVDPNPPAPTPGPFVVTAQVTGVNAPVESVRVFVRRMFGAEAVLPLRDDGAGGDVTANDGVWTAEIPAAWVVAGQMTRWRFVATDTTGTTSRAPTFHNPLDSEQYYGTVAQDDTLRSALPVLHWFTTNVARAGTSAGARGSVYYAGEFYDNVLFTLHGQSSAGFPKKSYNLDFNRTHRFRWSTNAPRVADIDLLTNWADKSKVRHVLAYEVMRQSGVAAHFAFTVRVQQNSAFFSTADFVEDADELYLERAGLNPNGALYKVYQNTLNKDAGDTATSGIEKKTRRTENNTDLQDLINGLDLTGQALERYLYDNIDLASCVNLIAASSVIRNIDMHAKNWYLYRDTGRSGEWAMLPWDLDLSHGRTWTTQDTYFDNALYTDDYVINGTAIRLVAQLFQNANTRAMLLRRIRTLTDRFLQPPPAAGTPESALYYERRLNEQSALIDPPDIVPSDAQLDFEKWGSWLQGGAVVSFSNPAPAVESMVEAIQRWKTEYLPKRRAYIYGTQIVGRGGIIPQPQTGGDATTNYTALVTQGAAVRAFVPVDASLGSNWTGDPAQEPFATTGWLSGTTGAGYERASGYEAVLGLNLDSAMRANNSVFLRLEFNVADPAAFDRLQLRMKYDDGFAAYLNGVPLASANAPTPLTWNSAATVSHEANPAAFVVFEVSDKIAALRAGRNILAIHALNDSTSSSDMLFIPELHGGKFTPPPSGQPLLRFGSYDVSPASGNQDQEYVQVLNPNALAVDVSDWQITGGIEHVFPGGTVIPPNGALYLTPSASAFRARTVSPKGGERLFVQGGYRGHLSNLGETLVLRDASGATNTTLTYPGMPSDAQRYLVISEIMFHPVGDGLAEFLELQNISDRVTLDLTGLRFTAGVLFDFSLGAIRSLAPGQRVLVIRDQTAFTTVYGTNRPVAGVFAAGSALSNGGELLKLEDANNDTVREFTYDDAPPWPSGTENGRSLVLIAPETNPDPAVPTNWRASLRDGGSPGEAEVDGPPANPAGDLDGNGQPDLLDYALGNAPGSAPTSLQLLLAPGHLGDPHELQLLYPTNPQATGVRLTVVISTDLETWTDATSQLSLVRRETRADGREWVTWRLVATPGADRQRYLRLQATLTGASTSRW